MPLRSHVIPFESSRTRLRQVVVGGLWVVACLLMSLGCSPAIGDDCGSNVDCGTGRFCDRSQPGGYCTIANCQTNGCPDDSVCIRFDNDESYCMFACGGGGDCRSNYNCVKGFGVHAFCNATPLDELSDRLGGVELSIAETDDSTPDPAVRSGDAENH